MKLSLVKGTTSKIVHLRILNSSVTTGAGLTGLAFNTASLICYYIRPGDASATAITLANATIGTFTSGGFKEVDSTNAKGLYEFSIPNACLATGANQVIIQFQGAANMQETAIEIELTASNNQDSVRFGLTALPNAAAAAAGGLITIGSNNTSAITIGALNTGAVAIVGAFSISGAATLSSTLSVGATTLSALTVTNNLLVSGNSTVTGTTTHTGNVTFSGNFQVTGTTRLIDDVSIESGLVSAACTINQLTITNSVSIGTTLTITGTSTLGAVTMGNLTTAAISATTLSTSGTTTLNALTVTNATTLSGAVQFGSTFGITGAVTLSSTLGVGNTILNALTITNNLIVSGNSTVGGNTTHTGPVSLGSTLGVAGAITATNASNNIKGVDVTRWLGTTVSTPTVAGVPNVNTKTWNDLATVALPLISTVAGRTLDVNATGGAGLDWGNLDNPSTANNLSGTRISLCDLVTTVTNNPNAGNGAYTITATVTDGTNPLQGATVRVTSGINTFSSVSDASGHVTFSLNSGSYTVSATNNGYSFTPSVRTVTGNNAGTLYSSPIAMTAVVIPVAPVDPTLCRIYGYIRNTRTAAVMPGVRVLATLKPGSVSYAAGILVGREASAITDSNGLFQLDVIRNSSITIPTGTTWQITCKEASVSKNVSCTTATLDFSTEL